mmetsp:Transcript_13905/g.37307  ORF Transcript_13905/g.37307 Transcript_13905/m.37307 type:complete len:267 (+) Transcript_13905:296-1096(+)
MYLSVMPTLCFAIANYSRGNRCLSVRSAASNVCTISAKTAAVSPFIKPVESLLSQRARQHHTSGLPARAAADESGNDDAVLHSSEESAELFCATADPDAALLLEGSVDKGFGRGSRNLGFPTANLARNANIAALAGRRRGVYFGYALLSQQASSVDSPSSRKLYPVVLNYGMNPTFGDVEVPLVEAHLMHSFESDFYGAHLAIAVLGFLRDERKFERFSDLVANIRNDATVAQSLLTTACAEPRLTGSIRERLLALLVKSCHQATQ